MARRQQDRGTNLSGLQMRRHAGLVLLSMALMACSQQAATPTAGTSDGVQFEAEAGTIQAFTTPQTVADPRNGGRIINDPNASGGKAVILLGTNDNVRFVVPGSVKAGRYTVSVRGRGENYQGWPTVDLNDERQRRLAVATLDSATYVTRKFGEFDLKAGQVFNLSFINDLYAGRGRDRNAIVDYLVIEPVGTTPPPTPPPVNQAPTVTLRPIDNGNFPFSEDGPFPNNFFDDDHNITLEADASDVDGKIDKVEFYAGPTKIGEDTSAPYRLVLSRNEDADTTSMDRFTARAVDNKGATTTSNAQFAVYISIARFVPLRAVNLGGPALQVQSYDSVLLGLNYGAMGANGITTNGVSTVLPSGVQLVPAAEPDREALIRSALSRQGGLEVNVPVPNAPYDIYLWVRAEDATPYEIQMEGQAVSRFDPREANRWDRLGPFAVTVSDGVLSVASTGTAKANFSAIEVYRRPQVGDVPPTVTFKPELPYLAPAGQPFTLSIDASDPDGTIARVEYYAKELGTNRSFKLGEVRGAPFDFVWQNPPQSSFTVYAVATDNTGVFAATSKGLTFFPAP